MTQSTVNQPESSSGLGAFGGVYTPSILTILGVIMYLRFGWVVGNVGLLGTLVIVTLSTGITFLTALSVCVIATDRVIKGGGAYYMISRSLGIETGGAVGLPLYFAQALSVALYTIGFAESLVATFSHLNQIYVALIATILVGVLAITSAHIAIKAQYFIMAAIALSLVSFAFGKPVEPTQIEWWLQGESSFWEVFAVFFPAVTGIMAGVNMSGDLKDPIRALPTGTLMAVGTGYVIYMVLPIFLSFRAGSAALIENELIMKDMALWGPAILLGVWGATLSSAIGSMLGAPRVLQALARDGVLPDWLGWLGQGHGHSDEPRLGTVVTLGVAIAAVTVGDLNIIAPVLSMFFLTTYLVLNVTAGIEGFLQSPSFRPAFRVSWLYSLLGAIGCLIVMFLINALATVVAGVVVLLIYVWLQRRELRTAWGDVRRGIWIALLRTAILQLDHTDDDKNWRPNILVLAGAPTRRWPLIELADAFTHNRGVITVSSILPPESCGIGRKAVLEQRIRNYIERRGVEALVRLVTASNLYEGSKLLVELYGLGTVVPNTVLLGDCVESERREIYCQTLAYLHKANRNIVIWRENTLQQRRKYRKRIDIWWGGLQANGSLMLLLAYLLKTDRHWRGAQINLKLVVPTDHATTAARENLKQMLLRLRIAATPVILVADDRTFDQILSQSSKRADLVFLGLANPQGNFEDYYRRVQNRVKLLPDTILVLAAPSFPYEEILSKS